MDEVTAQGGSAGNNTGGSSRGAIFTTTHNTECMLPLTYRGMQVGCSRAGAQAGRSAGKWGRIRAAWDGITAARRQMWHRLAYSLLAARPPVARPLQVDSCVSIAGAYLCWGQDTDAWEGCPQDVALKQARRGGTGLQRGPDGIAAQAAQMSMGKAPIASYVGAGQP